MILQVLFGFQLTSVQSLGLLGNTNYLQRFRREDEPGERVELSVAEEEANF